MPKVSVIVPIYNAQQFLEETLQSLYHQTLSDIEILCVDDGSTDKSCDILKAASERDTRIRIFNKANGGVGSARNLGLASAAGEYLLFIDADDIVSEDYLEQLYSSTLPEKPDIVVTGNVLNYWPDGSKTLRNVGVTGEATLTALAEKAPLITVTALIWNKLYRTAFIRSIGLQHYRGKSVVEDNYFVICSVALATSIKTISRGTYLYRQLPQSMSNTRKRPDDTSIYDVYDKARAFVFASPGLSDEASEWDAIITKRQKIDLTNYHYELNPPERAKFRELAKHMTQRRVIIVKPRNESWVIIKFHIKSMLSAIGLYRPSM
ncbi:glycosyltransferase family 2 protein [Marinobacter sp. M3C]|jgi:glycosyltransferase involved in cell wall biosynthesis|uniref:glycosyltransferase family 2 protein n=1 Tax=Marinobacter sp. M3C TaxID=2917715 RepID=UPI00200FBE8D|nr:glycosyltransferase family A protein [Marinobacter sp. M3C]UQG60429.1 glycosyltransferase family 2 protein [Marinobacter sp. M3C]